MFIFNCRHVFETVLFARFIIQLLPVLPDYYSMLLRPYFLLCLSKL